MGEVADADVDGLQLAASNNYIHGVGITEFGGAGVVVLSGTGNTIRGNSIYSNGGLGIDLGGDGVTKNDGRDLDEGPNDLQNVTAIGLAQTGAITRVAGNLHSTPSSTFTLDFYASTIDDFRGGSWEGRRWLGSGTVTMRADGNGDYDVVLTAATESGETITATVTNANGSTSEFSQGLLDNVPANTFVVTNTNDSGLGSLRNAIVAANQVPGTEPVYVWFRLPTTDPNFVDVDAHLPGGDLLPDVYVFSPQTALPPLTRVNTTIDGESQFKISGRGKNPFGPMIVLNGGAITGDANGLHLASSNNHVHGLNIQQFSGDGILIDVAEGAALTGLVDKNAFLAATAAEAVAPLENVGFLPYQYTTTDGRVTISANMFVGALPGDGVVDDDWTLRLPGPDVAINGVENLDYLLAEPAYAFGFDFVEPEFDPNVFAAFVDSTFTVTLKLGSAVVGTFDFNAPEDTASFVGIASAAPFDRVEIRETNGSYDNEFFGRMYIGNTAPAANNNTLTGNYIGTNATGDGEVQNSDDGVQIVNSRGNLIGGTTEAARNIISGNSANGISIIGGVAREFYDREQFLTATGANDATGSIPNLGKSSGEVQIGTLAFRSAPGSVLRVGRPDVVDGDWYPQRAGNEIAFDGIENFNVDLPEPVHSFGFEFVEPDLTMPPWGGDPVESEFTATMLLGGEIVDSITFSRDNDVVTFVGFTSPHAFDRVEIRETTGTNDDEYFGRFYFGTSAVGNTIQGNYIGTTTDGLTGLGNGTDGVSVGAGASNTVIGGPIVEQRNVISGNGKNNLVLSSNRTIVQGNYIGTDATGASLPIGVARGRVGIRVGDDLNSQIGGTDPGAGNVIAGHIWGIYLSGRFAPGGAEGTRIQGNRIGTTVDGQEPIANTWGIYLDGFVDTNGVTRKVSNTLIGGTEEGAGNLVSGNQNDGIVVFGPGSTGAVVQGNRIGTDIDGVDALPNGTGVLIENANGVLVGGTTKAARNVISGNSANGILIEGGSDHTIQGNYIGTTADGMDRLGNAAAGISLEGSSGNLIGGTTPGARNVISANDGGIRFSDQSDANLTIGNYIGVGADGSTDLGNVFGVIYLLSDDNQLGGLTPEERNVIAGNRHSNVLAGASSGNVIQGNYVGLNAAGDDRVYFSSGGVTVLNNYDILIGGVEPGAGNVISGVGRGIWLYGGNAARSTTIQGNLIGTSANGGSAVGNQFGIRLAAGGDGMHLSGNRVFDTLIGGLDPAARNVISGNTTGISIEGENALNTTIQGNYIGTDITGVLAIPNTQHGIHLIDTGDVLIGGTEPGARNVISGNAGDGVHIEGTAPDIKYQTFYSSLAWQAGWIGYGNTDNRNHFRSNLNLDVLGGDNFVAGGRFARNSTALGETGLTPISYYGDPRIGGTLTLDDPIHADGELIITDSDEFDGGVLASFFDRSNAEENSLASVLGLVILEPGGGDLVTGLRMKAVLALGNSDLLFGTSQTGAAINAPDGLSEDTSYSWRYDYDPQGGIHVQGRLTVEVFADGTSLGTNWIDLTAEQREVGASFDAFGLYTGNGPAISNSPNTVTLYIDTVTYTRAVGNTIQGNYIGTTADGMSVLGNGETGVSIESSAANLISGAEGGARNVISGNLTGVHIVGKQSTGNRVAGNFIGVGSDGETDVGNYHGVTILGDFGSDFGAPNNLIGGSTEAERNIISGNDRFGVFITRTLGNTIQGNYIGTDVTGTERIGNHTGVYLLNDRDSLIGGKNRGSGNLISGNGSGVTILGGLTQGSRLAGNFVGTTADGQRMLANTNHGLAVDGAHGVTIGGTLSGAGNLISGNGLAGIRALGANLSDLRIQGNKIGTDIDGVDALPNGTGVLIENTSGVLVGDTTEESRNVISGNLADGISIQGGSDHTIQGNYIGTTADGMSALSNGDSGVRIADSTNNLIGGTNQAARNLISGNVLHGVVINNNATENMVQGNYIGTDSDGENAIPNAFGVAIGSADNVLGGGETGAGNVISGNSASGVVVNTSQASGNRIQGNLIGTNALGTAALANGFFGVHLQSGANGNIVGTNGDGTLDEGERNVISGNLKTGLWIDGETSTGNVVAGNFIGTDVIGTNPIANQAEGLAISYAGGNTIGGTTPAQRNVISGNAQAGIQLEYQTDIGNTVIGNYIGTDVTGTQSLGNGWQIEDGIFLREASNNVIGGLTEAERNVISGNINSGIGVFGGSGNTIQCNYIGTDATGTIDLGNAVSGVKIDSGSTRNLIGGLTDAARNVISGNDITNVTINGATTGGNIVQGNYIGTNAAGDTDISGDNNLG